MFSVAPVAPRLWWHDTSWRPWVGQAQAKVTPTLPNATHEALSVGVGSQEPLPSLVTRQGGELTSMVWLNGEFRTKPWTQVMSGATPSPPDLDLDEVSGDESTEPEGT